MTNFDFNATVAQALADGMTIQAATSLASHRAINAFEHACDAANEDQATGGTPFTKSAWDKTQDIGLDKAQRDQLSKAGVTGCCDFSDEISTTEMIDNDSRLSMGVDHINFNSPEDMRLKLAAMDGEIDDGAAEFAKQEGNCEDNGPGVLQGLYNRHDELMAQAGASDEEIAAVNYVDELEAQLVVGRNIIGDLLAKLDKSIGMHMHDYGSTPSWYVQAAAFVAGVELEPTSDMCQGCGDPLASLHGSIVVVKVPLADRLAEEMSLDTDFEDHMTDALGRNDPVDFGDFGAGTRGDEAAEGFPTYVPVKDYVDLGEDLSHAEKVAAGMPEHKDCDVPATLRAVDIHATENSNSYRLWFDGDGELNQFLASHCLYAEPGGLVKDRDGEVAGVWCNAHFGNTPVS